MSDPIACYQCQQRQPYYMGHKVNTNIEAEATPCEVNLYNADALQLHAKVHLLCCSCFIKLIPLQNAENVSCPKCSKKFLNVTTAKSIAEVQLREQQKRSRILCIFFVVIVLTYIFMSLEHPKLTKRFFKTLTVAGEVVQLLAMIFFGIV